MVDEARFVSGGSGGAPSIDFTQSPNATSAGTLGAGGNDPAASSGFIQDVFSSFRRLFSSSRTAATAPQVTSVIGCGVSGGVGMRANTANERTPDAESPHASEREKDARPPFNFKFTDCKRPQPQELIKVPLRDIVIVDNGDGYLDMGCLNDYFTDHSGRQLSFDDPKVRQALSNLGISVTSQSSVYVVKEIGNLEKILEPNIKAIKGTTDETVVWQKFDEIRKAADKANIRIYPDAPLFDRVLYETTPMSYVIHLGMAREYAEKQPLAFDLEQMNQQLTKASRSFCESHGKNADLMTFSSRVEEIRLSGFQNAIKYAEAYYRKYADDVEYCNLSGLNRSLDNILREAMTAGVLNKIVDDVRRIRVSGYRKALDTFTRIAKERPWLADEKISYIEQSAKAYGIYDDIKDDIQKAHDIRNPNNQKM